MILFAIYGVEAVSDNIIHHGKTEGIIELSIHDGAHQYLITKKLKIINGVIDVVSTYSMVNDVNQSTILDSRDVHPFGNYTYTKYILHLSPTERFTYFSQLCNIKNITNVHSQIKNIIGQYTQSLNTNQSMIKQLVIVNGTTIKNAMDKEYDLNNE